MAGLRALVTAGGTREPIDDVRVLTNLSSGRFGTLIARALSRAGVETTLLGSAEALSLQERLGPVPGGAPLTTARFSSTDDLQAALASACARAPDLVLMAAAVSDYRPRRQAGKLRSDAAELVLTLERTPKLLDELRARCGPAATLVGFKLLSGVPRAALVVAAREQVARAGLDWCVANDLRELSEGAHPVLLVPRGSDEPARLEGPPEQVAERLVGALLRARGLPPAPPAPGLGTSGRGVWERLEAAGLAPRALASSGGGGGPDEEGRRLSALLPHLSGVEAVARLPWGLALPEAEVATAAPAGAPTESAAVLAVLAARARAGAYRGGSFHLARPGESLLLGWSAPDLAALPARLEALLDQARPAFPAGAPLRALFAGPAPQAVSARLEAGTALWVAPEARRRGLGERLLRRLAAAGEALLLPRGDAGARAFARARGFLEAGGERGALLPPGQDLPRGASLCLRDALSGRVLLGQRRRGPFQGSWSFPGGKLEPGEAPLTAARRELREETALEALAEPLARWEVWVGDGQRPPTRVTCFEVPCLGTPAPRPSEELDPRWLTLEEALALPLAPGVRGVLLELA